MSIFFAAAAAAYLPLEFETSLTRVLTPCNYRGAVLSRLPGEAVVTSTSAVRHYGVESSSIYDWVRDDGERSWINKYEGTTRVHRVSGFDSVSVSLMC